MIAGQGVEVVDVHHHIGAQSGINPDGSYGAADILADMDANGVAQTVAMHFVSALRTEDAFSRANELVVEAVEKDPSRLFGAVVVSPFFEGTALRDIDTCQQAGFRMVKLHPLHHGNYSLNDGLVDRIVERSGSLGMPVLIHSDSSSAICSPHEVASLARRFPETDFILAHLGLHPDHIKRVPEIVADLPNVYLDTAQTPDYPFDVYVRPCRVLGSDRVLFGSDGPECSVSLNLRKAEMAMSEGLTLEDLRQVLGGNAKRLLRLPS